MRPQYRKTDTILDRILAHKQAEITACKQIVAEAEMRERAAAAPRGFLSLVDAIRTRQKVALIAEIKHASPSKGILIEDFDPVSLGRTYAQYGAAAISVLTDERFFQGHLDHLVCVREAVDTSVPLLRKDFIIDPYQIYEAAAAGASAILLIVAALDDSQLIDLHTQAAQCQLDALVEVHNEHELDRALHTGASLVGINNRDLRTFYVSLDVTNRLAKLVPPDVLLVAESGIQQVEDVRKMGECGADAVLIGEAIVKAREVLPTMIREFSSQPRMTRR